MKVKLYKKVIFQKSRSYLITKMQRSWGFIVIYKVNKMYRRNILSLIQCRCLNILLGGDLIFGTFLDHFGTLLQKELPYTGVLNEFIVKILKSAQNDYFDTLIYLKV